jgi:hypothetical protein
MGTEYGLKQMWPDKVTDTSTTAVNGLGVLRFEGNKTYVYVLCQGGAAVLGDSLCAASTADGIVTMDRNGGGILAFCVRGVAIGAIASGSYGWIQKQGICVVQCDGGVSAGDGLIPSANASSDGHADTAVAASDAANTEYQTFGFALTADAGSADGDTATAYINCK